MKSKEFSVIFLLLTVLTAAGCGKSGRAAKNPADIIDLLGEYSGRKEIVTLYTDETIDEFRKFINLSGVEPENSYSILSFVPDKSEVEVTGETCDGNICTLTIRFLQHPVENMKGFSFDIIVRQEGDNWKIDRSKDFQKMSMEMEKNGAGVYLKNL